MAIETMIRSIVREELAALLPPGSPPLLPPKTFVVHRYAHVLLFFESMPPGSGGKAADVYAAFLAWQAGGPPTPEISLQRFGRMAHRSALIERRVTSGGTTYTRRDVAA